MTKREGLFFCLASYRLWKWYRHYELEISDKERQIFLTVFLFDWREMVRSAKRYSEVKPNPWFKICRQIHSLKYKNLDQNIGIGTDFSTQTKTFNP